MSDPDAIFFDIDGTLVDSNELHVDVWDRVFREAGFPIDRDALRSQVGKGGDNYVPSLLPQLAKDRQEALAERHGELFKAEYFDRVQPFPGAVDVLRRAHELGIKVVLASSAGGDELDHYVELLGARPMLAETVSKDDVERSKPEPDIFSAALAKIDLPADRVLVVGDTPYDVEAAQRCGIASAAVLSGGFSEWRLRLAGARHIYPDIAAFGRRLGG